MWQFRCWTREDIRSRRILKHCTYSLFPNVSIVLACWKLRRERKNESPCTRPTVVAAHYHSRNNVALRQKVKKRRESWKLKKIILRDEWKSVCTVDYFVARHIWFCVMYFIVWSLLFIYILLKWNVIFLSKFKANFFAKKL